MEGLPVLHESRQKRPFLPGEHASKRRGFSCLMGRSAQALIRPSMIWSPKFTNC